MPLCLLLQLQLQLQLQFIFLITVLFIWFTITEAGVLRKKSIIVTASVKTCLIADPNSTYLDTRNLIGEFSTTLKFGPNIPLTYHYCLV